MELVVKKTTELTAVEKQELLDCFVEVFVEHERSMEEMCNQYMNTPMGYCVHALCYDENKLVGAHTAFPSYYWYGINRVKTYFTGDTMVKKGYRDGFVYLDLVHGITKYMKQEGYVFSFGFPNENSYPVVKKAKLGKDIGRLDTYILPYRIGGVRKGLGWLNPLSKLFCNLWLSLSGIGLSDELYLPLIHKDDESYNVSRYKRMDGNYCHVESEKIEFYYKVKEHEGVRTALLIDVVGKTERTFHYAVKYIMRKEKKDFDLLLYVGHLPKSFRKTGLVKIPRRFEPKHFYMTGSILAKDQIDEKEYFDITNWDVNLSNYDVI